MSTPEERIGCHPRQHQTGASVPPPPASDLEEDRRQRAIQAGRNLMDAYNGAADGPWHRRFAAVMGYLNDDGDYEFILSEGKPCRVIVRALDH